MIAVFWKRYLITTFSSILFFYLGCEWCANAEDKNEVTISNTNYLANENVQYAVVILTGPGNHKKRDAIRATWMNLKANIISVDGELLYKWNIGAKQEKQTDYVKFYFVLGLKNLGIEKILQLSSENEKYHDILFLEEHNDVYLSLTDKTLYALQWINNNLKNFKYLIKCDDDSFVRVDMIIKDLELYAPEMNSFMISEFVTSKNNNKDYKGLYWGYFKGNAQVFSNGKWREDAWFLCERYLPYALGGGYVISRSIVNYIAKNIDFLSRYNAEDVSMGVWTAALDGINRVHDTRFDTEWVSRGCSNQMLIRHKQTPLDMHAMYKMILDSKGEKQCIKENAISKQYLYNWNKLPSSCCQIRQ